MPGGRRHRLGRRAIPDHNIAECIDDAKDAQSACDQLIKLALGAGGRDNITAILARAKAR